MSIPRLFSLFTVASRQPPVARNAEDRQAQPGGLLRSQHS